MLFFSLFFCFAGGIVDSDRVRRGGVSMDGRGGEGSFSHAET